MSIPIRPLLGFAAGATSMALVVLAGITAPPVESTVHASAHCPDQDKESPLQTAPDEAQRPA